MKKTAILSMLLCLCLVLSLVLPSVSAFASPNEEAPGGSTSDSVGGGNSSENDTSDSVDGADTPDTPVVEKVTMTITSWETKPYEIEKSKVAVNQDGLTNPADWALIIYNSDFKGACVTGAKFGVAIVIKDGKIVRAYDGTNGKYHDAENKEGISGVCTTDNYATVAFESLKEGEILIIAPNGGSNNTEPGSRWYVHRYGRAIGNDIVLTGVTFPEPEQPEQPEQPEGLSGTIKVMITDNNAWVDIATFVAPEDGVYTFTISAGMGAWDKNSKQNWSGAPYVDPMMEEDRDGGSFEVTLKKGETYEFYVQNPTKNVEVEIAWTAATAEPEQPAGGVIKVTITDNNCWNDLATFVAPEDGVYTFVISAGMGAWDKNACENFSSEPYVDPNMEDGREGGSFSVTLKKGETYEFYVQYHTKNVDVEINWTMAAAEIPAEPQDTTAVLGENTIVIPEGQEGVEYTFVVTTAANYTFASNDLKVRILDSKGMQMGMGFANLQPGTYTLSCYANGQSGSFTLTITSDAPTNVLNMGENTVVITDGQAGAEYTITIEVAGEYYFQSSDMMINVFDEHGMMIRLMMGKGFLNPGKYTVSCYAMGATGSFKLNISKLAPTVVVGENTVVIEDGKAGAEYSFEVYEEGYYIFSSQDVGAIVYNAAGEMAIKGEGTLAPGNYTVIFFNIEEKTGEFTVTISLKGEEIPEENTIQQLPHTITGEGAYDVTFGFTATEDGILEVIFNKGSLYVSGGIVGGASFEKYEDESGYFLEVKAGDVLTINPWQTEGGEFEIVIQMKEEEPVTPPTEPTEPSVPETQPTQPTQPGETQAPTTQAPTQPTTGGTTGGDETGSPVVTIVVIVVVVAAAAVVAVILLKKKK